MLAKFEKTKLEITNLKVTVNSFFFWVQSLNFVFYSLKLSDYDHRRQTMWLFFEKMHTSQLVIQSVPGIVALMK